MTWSVEVSSQPVKSGQNGERSIVAGAQLIDACSVRPARPPGAPRMPGDATMHPSFSKVAVRVHVLRHLLCLHTKH